MTFHLIIATPEKVAYDDEVESVTVPGSLGYMQILINHASLISSLRPGNVTFVTKNQERRNYTISGGFFEVSHNKATLLADSLSILSESSRHP
jgi:F-type H+-transporting ATPase subunit epsilon